MELLVAITQLIWGFFQNGVEDNLLGFISYVYIKIKNGYY